MNVLAKENAKMANADAKVAGLEKTAQLDPARTPVQATEFVIPTLSPVNA